MTTTFRVGDIIRATFPSLNKNDTIARNDEEIRVRSDVSRCKVRRVIELSFADWCEMTNSLLADRDLWGQIGGQNLSNLDQEAFAVLCQEHGADPERFEQWICNPPLKAWFMAHCFTEVVVATCEGQRPLIVNTEGYTYARYSGRYVDHELKPGEVRQLALLV